MSSYPDDYIFKSQHEWCFDASVGVLIHQQKIREIVDGSKNMFIYHGLGSGKTCTTLLLAEALRIAESTETNSVHIFYIGPKAVSTQFKDEYQNCMNRSNLNLKKEKTLRQLNRIRQCEKDIDDLQERIRVLSQYRDKTNVMHTEIETLKSSLSSKQQTLEQMDVEEFSMENITFEKHESTFKKNSKIVNTIRTSAYKFIFIIDEIQKYLPDNDKGTNDVLVRDIINLLHQTKRMKCLLLLSATPINNYAVSVSKLIHLLNPNSDTVTPTTMPLGRDHFINRFSDPNDLVPYLRGHVSYLSGGHPNAFPMKRICIIEHPMTDNQLSEYIPVFRRHVKTTQNMEMRDIEDGNKQSTKDLMTLSRICIASTNYDDSPKLNYVLDCIDQIEGTAFIYCPHVKDIVPLFERLAAMRGSALYNDSTKNVQKLNGKRYVIWSGDAHELEIQGTMRVFNRTDNIDGTLIKMIYGTKTVAEGISLFNIQQVHILNVWWSKPHFFQVIARAVRFRSHCRKVKDNTIPLVTVFFHIATYNGGKVPNIHPTQQNNIHNFITIDQYQYKKAIIKYRAVLPYEQIMKKTAIDCSAFQNGNLVRLDEYFVPYTSIEYEEDCDRDRMIHYFQNPATLEKYVLEDVSKTFDPNVPIQPCTITKKQIDQFSIPYFDELKKGEVYFQKCTVRNDRMLCYGEQDDTLQIVDGIETDNRRNIVSSTLIVFENIDCIP